MDWETFEYLEDNIRGWAPVDRTRSQSNDIIYFEEEMEWQVQNITDFWMDHEEELVDHEFSWMTHYYSAMVEHYIEDECAKFRI